MKTIKFKRVHTYAKCPEPKIHGDVGYDLSSCKHLFLEPGKVTKVNTGIKITDYGDLESVFFKIEGRSGLASRGIFPVGGIIDKTYRGEIIVLLMNTTDEPFEVKIRDRIAQLVLYNVGMSPNVTFQEDDSNIISKTIRGSNGFESTGR